MNVLFFLLISLHQVFQGTVRQEDSLDEAERTWCWDFSSGSASCWPGWSWTERDNVRHPKWRWQWPHWPLLHPVLFSALSITFEGDINTQECTQVAGDGGGNGRQVKMLRSCEALVYGSKFPLAIVRLIAHGNCLCSQYFGGQSR